MLRPTERVKAKPTLRGEALRPPEEMPLSDSSHREHGKAKGQARRGQWSPGYTGSVPERAEGISWDLGSRL